MFAYRLFNLQKVPKTGVTERKYEFLWQVLASSKSLNWLKKCLWLALSLLEIGIQEHCSNNKHENASDDILDMTCHRSCWWRFPPKNWAVIRSLGVYEFNPQHEKQYSPYEIHLGSLWWRGITHSRIMIGCFHLHHQISLWGALQLHRL